MRRVVLCVKKMKEKTGEEKKNEKNEIKNRRVIPTPPTPVVRKRTGISGEVLNLSMISCFLFHFFHFFPFNISNMHACINTACRCIHIGCHVGVYI